MQILANDARLTYIGRWIDTVSGSNPVRVSISAGCRLRFKFTGTTLGLSFNEITQYVSEIEYCIDGGAWFRANAVGSATLAQGLQDNEHTFELYTASMRGWYRWTNLDGVRLKSITLDDGKSVSAWPTGLPKMLTLGDSIASGDLVLPDGATSGRLSLSSQLAASLGYENWNVAAGGTGFYGTQTANGFPATQINYLSKCDGVTRDDPSFDLVFIEAIQNDGLANRYAEYTTLLAQLRIDQPAAKIFSLGLIFPDPQDQPSVRSAAAAYGATYLSPVGWVYSHPQAVNASHPDVAGVTALVGYIAPTISAEMATTTTTSTTTSTTSTTTTAAPGPAELPADNLNGWGTLSNGNLGSPVTTTLAPKPDPPNISLAAGDRAVTVSWTPVRGASSYNVYYAWDFLDFATGAPQATVIGNSVTFGGLINGTWYFFGVEAVGPWGKTELLHQAVDMASPRLIDPLRFFANGVVLSFAETKGGPLRIKVGRRILEFAVGGGGPVRFNSAAGVVALSSPSDITVPQDMYSGGSLDLAALSGVLGAADMAGANHLDAGEAVIADTLPSDDLASGSTLGAAGAIGVMVASSLTGSGTITTGTAQNALVADQLASTGTLDQAVIGTAGVVGDDLNGVTALGPADLTGAVPADDLATTGALDVPVAGGVIASNDVASTGALTTGELVVLGGIGADALDGSGTLDPANLTMPDALPANDLAGGAGTLSTANLASNAAADSITGSGTLDAADTWIPTSTVGFTNYGIPLSTITFTNFS